MLVFVILTVFRRVLCRAGGTPRTARWSRCGPRWCPTITCRARRAPWPRPSRAPSERPRSTSATAPTGTGLPGAAAQKLLCWMDSKATRTSLCWETPSVILWTGNLSGVMRMGTNKTRIGNHVNIIPLMPCSPQFQCCHLEYVMNY